jgi:hypothetical protein
LAPCPLHGQPFRVAVLRGIRDVGFLPEQQQLWLDLELDQLQRLGDESAGMARQRSVM